MNPWQRHVAGAVAVRVPREELTRAVLAAPAQLGARLRCVPGQLACLVGAHTGRGSQARYERREDGDDEADRPW